MRTFAPGHIAFALLMIAVGIQGAITGGFTTVWAPVPAMIPFREPLAYLCAVVSFACGLGLLWRRGAPLASRVLTAVLALWFLLWRVQPMVTVSFVGGSWSAGASLVYLAAAWVLFADLATDTDRRRLGFATGRSGLRIAHALYGLAMIPFGYAHFQYLARTASLIPGWLPWPTFWACFTGGAFIAAGVSMLFGVLDWLAAPLSALMMAGFSVFVWIPRYFRGNLPAFEMGEVVATFALTAAAWAVAESYGYGRRTALESAPR